MYIMVNYMEVEYKGFLRTLGPGCPALILNSSDR
jgi:hypothetical protein